MAKSLKMLKRSINICLAAWLLACCCSPFAIAEGENCGSTHLTDADRATLMKATVVTYREPGDSNQPSALWKAFQKYKKFGVQAKDEIQTLLDKATPAGRIYGVILLRQFDPKGASKVIAKMQSDTTPVIYQHGCAMMSTSVKDLAKRISSGEEIVKLAADSIK